MENISQNSYTNNITPNKNGGTSYITVFVIVVVLIFISYVFYNTIRKDTKEEKRIYSQEEKLEILNSVSNNYESKYSTEEKREILESVSKTSNSETLGDNQKNSSKYTKEEKLNILYSIQ